MEVIAEEGVVLDRDVVLIALKRVAEDSRADLNDVGVGDEEAKPLETS
jgi:hypothetical protein